MKMITLIKKTLQKATGVISVQYGRISGWFERRAELNKTKQWLDGFDKDHVWAFNSGSNGADFRGNPKYLFVYVNNYRPDIRAYWITQDLDTVRQVRALGFTAFYNKSPSAAYAMERTGVAVAEQVKEHIPFPDDVRILNLWHGNGFKSSERARTADTDDLRLTLAKKYILNNPIYLNQMIVCCVSSLQESYLKEYMGITENQVLRTGYLRCAYQKNYKPIASFDHDILSRQGLPKNTRIAVYAPTFRSTRGNTFLEALPDLESLYRRCEQNHILLIFKMHPMMEKEDGFIRAQKRFKGQPYFLFWDNRDDIYEVFHRFDLLIYDYSSIFSDFLLGGVKHFIRYIYDSSDMLRAASVNSEEEYYDYTLGRICKTESELIDALPAAFEEEFSADRDRVMHRLWEYASEDDFEKTIRFAMDFEVGHQEYPTLYSFDIFDTVFSREGLDPVSIFYAVKEKIRESGKFAAAFSEAFVGIRQGAEANVRYYKTKYQEQRNTIHTEITLREIYERVREVYDLNTDQTESLINWEIEAELDAVVPLPEQIDTIKKLLSAGETVILISDMYLPKDTVERMLEKADPVLAELPLFLSNEYGVLKSNALLYFEVYRSFKPFYGFGKWVHTGDNLRSDQNMARTLNICTRLISKPELNDIESGMVSELDSYDGYLVAAIQARLRRDHHSEPEKFIIDYIAPMMVSYVDWVLRDAAEQGFETLYFVSRDGYPLKLIADALNDVYGYPIKTKYIYGSRRTWRIPSYIDEIDNEFWSEYGGNFVNIRTKSKFLHAAAVENEEMFRQLCPELDLSAVAFGNWTDGQPAQKLAQALQRNEQYRDYLLSVAKKQRELVCGYLRQEIDPDEKHAYVEFWGRGYNQRCHSRLWNYTVGKKMPLHYYYARSAEVSQGECIHHDMTTNARDLFFMESIFANMPYRSIEKYEMRDGKIEPVIEPISHDGDLFAAMETLLPKYARKYASARLNDASWTDRRVFDFLLDYFYLHQNDPFIYENFGSRKDAISMYESKQEFAPPLTKKDIKDFANGVPRGDRTRSVVMSYARSPETIRKQYEELYQLTPGEEASGGRRLNKKEIGQNRHYRRLLDKERAHAEQFGRDYAEACKKTVIENRISLICSDHGSDAFRPIIQELKKQNVFSVETIFLNKRTCLKTLAGRLARSRFVLSDRCVPLFSEVKFRSETRYILLESAAFSFFAKGTKADNKLVQEREYRWFTETAEPSAFEASSETVKNELLGSVIRNSQDSTVLNGCSATDNYYDAEFVSLARKKIAHILPEAESRKILLFIPTYRKDQNRNNWLKMVDLTRLHELVGDEYAVIIDNTEGFSLFRYNNELDVPKFSKVVSRGVSSREMIAAADAVIGDYKDIFFECAVLDKPAFSSANDYEQFMKANTFICDYGRVCPFPIVNSADDLAERLSDLERYDFSPANSFRRKYLTYCDGHSAARLAAWMLSAAAQEEQRKG